MTSLIITPSTLHNEEKYIVVIEQLEKRKGRKIKEVVLKNMVLTVKEWKE